MFWIFERSPYFSACPLFAPSLPSSGTRAVKAITPANLVATTRWWPELQSLWLSEALDFTLELSREQIFLKQLFKLRFPYESPASMSTLLHSRQLAVFVLYLCLKREGFSYLIPVISLVGSSMVEKSDVSVFCCPLAMQIRVLSALVPAWGRREVASWGEEGPTRDLGWKLRVSLQLLFSPSRMVSIACDWCAVINHAGSFPSSKKDTELRTEKLIAQSTFVYIIFKVLSAQVCLVWIYTTPCLLHGKSWVLPKDVFAKGKN